MYRGGTGSPIKQDLGTIVFTRTASQNLRKPRWGLGELRDCAPAFDSMLLPWSPPALKVTYLRRYDELWDVSTLHYIVSEPDSTLQGRTRRCTGAVRAYRGCEVR